MPNGSAYGMRDGVFFVVRRCSLRAQIASFCSLSIVIFRQISPALLHGLLHFWHSFWSSACAFQADTPPCCSRSSTYFCKVLAETRSARPIRIVGNSPVAIISYIFEGDNGNALIPSNRATKETRNQHENFRKRWLNKTSYLFPKKCVFGIHVI